jgi:uncharacterized protein
MRNTLFVKPLALLAVLASVLVVALAPQAHAECCLPPDRVLSTQGHSDIKLRPDSLSFTMAVEATAPTLTAVRQENNVKLQKILTALKALNYPHLVLQTNMVQYNPIHRAQEKNKLPTRIGYQANSSLQATLKNVSTAELGTMGAQLVEAALRSGADNVGSLNFFVDDMTAARREALKKAVEDAVANATIMATAAGAKIEGVLGIDGSPQYNVGGYVRSMPMLMKSAMADVEVAQTPALEAGENTLTSDVSLRFLLKNTTQSAMPSLSPKVSK